ncbi:MAG: UDP-N-acetylmuramoyl-L-alanine--D-glutamate ligase [Candidatus Eisenbacteria bacterium]|uniref:UDP-N-acetylmuramoylalanine--D-glutamate ligase n=1 Tax=Eiseniibacteriota bacterium TaxID=2212470 RepID=A0A7Y2EAG8_UNCEI|nr:UDP-N-acetylmuramoyl-L-alanine--D-glutamate ligase [Candidatus Eisenbacteria bacterium]
MMPKRPEDWQKRRVVVVGMARSGQSVCKLLAEHGAEVTGTDLRSPDVLKLDLESMAHQHIRLVLGQHPLDLLDDCDVLIVSPGVPKKAPFLQEAERRGIPRISEIEVASQFLDQPIAATTGTNGKSTTTQLVGDVANALGMKTAVAGNIGWPLSDVVDEDFDAISLELSSYQLEDIVKFKPHVAALLNVTPDHLDRYRNLDHYRETKERIFENQDEHDMALLPSHESWDDLAARLVAKVYRFGASEVITQGAVIREDGLVWREHSLDHSVLAWEDFPLMGQHNRENAAAALGLLIGLGVEASNPKLGEAFAKARALPHRMEPAGVHKGVRFINDSKATNPESLEVALESFEGDVVLIAGGQAKEADYSTLVPSLEKCVKGVVLIGEARDDLAKAWSRLQVPMQDMGTDLQAAVSRAAELAAPKGVVLFSPGCASFDMFQDYEQRGDRFKSYVRAFLGDVS